MTDFVLRLEVTFVICEFRNKMSLERNRKSMKGRDCFYTLAAKKVESYTGFTVADSLTHRN